MRKRFRKAKSVIAIAIVALSWCQSVQAEPIDEETMLFLKSRAPGLLELIERHKEEGGDELEDAQERGIELREMFHEEKKRTLQKALKKKRTRRLDFGRISAAPPNEPPKKPVCAGPHSAPKLYINQTSIKAS